MGGNLSTLCGPSGKTDGEEPIAVGKRSPSLKKTPGSPEQVVHQRSAEVAAGAKVDGKRVRRRLVNLEQYRKELEAQPHTISDLVFMNYKNKVQMYGTDHVRVGTAFVEVKEARGLDSAMDKYGIIDPYVVLETPLLPRRQPCVIGLHQTRVASGTHPKWSNQWFEMPISNTKNGVALTVELWDKDKGKTDDLLGFCTVSYNRMMKIDKQGEEIWIPLMAPFKGEVCLFIRYQSAQNDKTMLGATVNSLRKDETRRALIPHASAFKSHRVQKHLPQHREELKKILPQMKTGDIIMFLRPLDHGTFKENAGEFIFTSLLQKAMQNSAFSHAGMLYIPTDKNGNRHYYLIESVTGVPARSLDMIMKSPNRNSIHCFNMFDRMETVEYSLLWHPLRRPLEKLELDRWERFVGRMWCNDPQFDFKQMIGAGVRILHNKVGKKNKKDLNKEDWTKVFCVELIVGALKLAGVKELEAINSSSLSPAELPHISCFDWEKARAVKVMDYHSKLIKYGETLSRAI